MSQSGIYKYSDRYIFYIYILHIYFSAKKSDAACLQFLRMVSWPIKKCLSFRKPIWCASNLTCHRFLLVAKIIYQFETFNIIRLLWEILHQLRYCIHHKNQRMIYLPPYQRVQNFFHHFYSGFTRRFASQLLRKSSHPSVQYRINHRNLLATISIKTLNTHGISDLNIDVQRMDQ